MSSRAIVRVTRDCDNACVMCGQAGEPSEAIDLAAIDLAAIEDQLVALRREHDELSFVGGEPTLRGEALVELVARARALGFAAIGLQTNARQLAATPSLLSRLHEAGLGDLQLSLHAATPAAHDYQVGRAGSHAAILDVLDRARRRGLTCVVVSVLTRSSYRELGKLPALLERQGAAAWLIEWVRPFGRAGESFARVVPRLGMALPWALAALDQARRSGLPAWIRGVPPCTLGPLAAHALAPDARLGEFAATCERCSARAHCPGIDPRYRERFGASELDARRVAASPAALSPAHARLARMFVGVGELVASEPPAKHEAGGKHRRLPLLPTPARSGAESEG
jgi:hypothetical protein